jgi:hypothetical protein
VVNGRFVVRDGALPGIDMQAAHLQAQAQFDRLVSRYPERTLGHPPVHEIFKPTYPAGSGQRGE